MATEAEKAPVLEGEVVDQAVAVPADLVVTQEPAEVLRQAHLAAKALTDVIRGKARPVRFNGETYLEYEDWQTVGRFYNVTARVVDVSPITVGDAQGWRATADAIRGDGQVVSSATALCLNDERNWKSKPMHQLMSMAQTRACAKALRNVLAWVAVLAGYKPTPAEEMAAEHIANPTASEIEGERVEIARVADKTPERQALIAQASHAWQTNPATAGVFMKDRKLSASITRWSEQDLADLVAFMKAAE